LWLQNKFTFKSIADFGCEEHQNHLFTPDNLTIIKVAKKASSKLNGRAAYSSPKGKTPIFPTTTQIKTKATNHERKTLCIKENFLEIIKIAIAKNKDQIPQTAPLIGSDGKISPRLS
jgi:hypothetical protein